MCLFHFVVNDERLFLRYEGNELNFTLNLDTEGGKELYNELKQKKTKETELLRYNNFFGNGKFFIKGANGVITGFVRGDIAQNGKAFYIFTNKMTGEGTLIGKFTDPNELNSLGNPKSLNVEFVLEQDEESEAVEEQKLYKYPYNIMLYIMVIFLIIIYYILICYSIE